MSLFINDDDKNYEIVDGDGSLNISPVYSHVNINKNNDNTTKKNIVIPNEKK